MLVRNARVSCVPALRSLADIKMADVELAYITTQEKLQVFAGVKHAPPLKSGHVELTQIFFQIH